MARPAGSTDSKPALGALRTPDLSGRERELGLLRHVLRTPPAVILVEGEAGIGKSRLLAELLIGLRAGQPGTPAALVAYCPPFRQPQTLGPVADALRQAEAAIPELALSALCGALRPLFPEWGDYLPAALEPPADAGAARHRLFGALAELLGRLKVEVLAVEDAQWADDATLEFLLYLAARQPREVSIVASYRAGDVPAGSLLPRLARHAAGSHGLQLALEPLGVDATAQLAQSMLGGEQVSAELAAFLHGSTDGVPLAAEESLRLMAARGDLVRGGRGVALRPHDDIPVPRSVRDAVLERAGRLDAGAQLVLQAASVLGDPADEHALAAVAGLAARQARPAIEAALRCGLLADRGRGLVTLAHALTTRSIYEAIPATQRARMHRRAAQALSGGPVDRLAHHFLEAGDRQAWAACAAQSASLAVASGDEAAAVTILSDLLDEGGEAGLRASRQLDSTAFGSLDSPGVHRRLITGLRALLASGACRGADVGRVRFQLGSILRVAYEWDAARAELTAAIPHLDGDPERAIRAMNMLGWPLEAISSAAEHRRWLDRAAQLAARQGTAAQTRTVSDRATALLLLGDEEGWALAARIPETSPASQECRAICTALLNTGEAAAMWGRYDDSRRRLARVTALAEQHGLGAFLPMARVLQGHLDWLTGNWAGLADRAHGLRAQAGDGEVVALYADCLAGLAESVQGEAGKAREMLGAVAAQWRRLGQYPLMMAPLAVQARLHLQEGRTGDALEVTGEPAELIARKQTWLWGTDLLPVRVSVLIAAGQAQEAAGLAAAYAAGLDGRDAPAPQAALHTAQALLAEAGGDLAQAAALFGRAAEGWQALPRPYDGLLARERQARCLLAGGREQEGHAALAAAAAGLEELGACGDAARARAALPPAAPRGRGGRRGYGGQLSPRELEVVQLLIAGARRAEIAQALFRSPKTIDAQLSSAMVKLGVTSRAALAARAAREGIALAGEPFPKQPEPGKPGDY